MNTGVSSISPEKVVSREPSIEELEASLVDARRAAARVEELRMGRSSDRLSEVEELTLAAYEAAKTAHGVSFLRDDVEAAEDEAAKNALTIEYLFNERELLSQEIDNPSALNRIQKLRRLGRSAVGAVGNWLSSGSARVQFLKSAAVTGVASVGAGVFGGVAAAGVMAGVRYAKGYAQGMAKRVTAESISQEEVTSQLGVAEFSGVEGAIVRASEILRADREKAVHTHQERNRDAHKRALGAMVVGAVVGTTIGSAIHSGFDIFGSTVAHASENASSHVSQGSINIPGAHATSGLIDITDSHEVAGTVDVQSGNLTFPGTSGVLGDHEVSGVVDVSGSHETPGAIDTTGGYETSGEIDITDSHEISGSVDVSQPIPDSVGRSFTVEGGHGYVHELIDAARANGGDMTPEQAWEAHMAIVDKHGSDYINMVSPKGPDVYSMGRSIYEVGISSPGEATWSVDAQPMIADAIDDGVINGSIHDGAAVSPGGHEVPVEVGTTDSHEVSGGVYIPGDHENSVAVDTSGSHEVASTIESAGEFSFGYGAAPESLIKEVVSSQLNYNLSGREAHLLVSHLMNETNGKIFEGVNMHWNVFGSDAWISDPGGSTDGLTEHAKKLTEDWLSARSGGSLAA